MKRISALALIITLALSLSACGKSQAAIAAENAISMIGEVTLDSEDAIINAEKLYGILTDSEKADVENRLTLTEARESYNKLQDELRKEKIYETAERVYDLLNDAAERCRKGLSDKGGAWEFGIYDAYLYSGDDFFADFANSTASLSSEQLSYAAELMDYSVDLMKDDWQYCVWTVETAIMLRGDHDEIDLSIHLAKKALQELTDEYGDGIYYPKLKDYYSEVVSYADFFENTLVSLSEFREITAEYESNIRAFKSELSVLF